MIHAPSRRSPLAALAFTFAIGGPAFAQSTTAAIDGPPPPIAPEVVTRDDSGRVTVRAIKLDAAAAVRRQTRRGGLRRDSAGQRFRAAGAARRGAGTERTEAWVMFDGERIYVAARCWDTAPPDHWVANELRRDTNQLRQNDTFGVIFDTFYDRRNGYLFYTNPLGALRRSGRHRRRQPERRLESGLGRAHGTLRRRVDRRDGHSVQVAPLPIGRRPGRGASTSGASSAARTSGRISRRFRHRPAAPGGMFRRVARRHAGRARPAAGQQEHRAEAVRDLAGSRPIALRRRRSRTIRTATSASMRSTASPRTSRRT